MYRSFFYSEISTLIKRLSHNYEQYPQMQDKLKNVEVGDYGEKYVANLLQNTFKHQLIVLSDMAIGSSQADCLVTNSQIKIISHNGYKVVYYKCCI